MTGCVICGDKVVVKRRCRTCYEYRRRHGHDRPLALIIRLTDRDIERERACKRERFAC